MKNKFYIFILAVFEIMNSEPSSFTFSGYSNFSYISRISDKSLINVPYRMGSIVFVKQYEDISLIGEFALEYHVRDDFHFIETSNPQDFTLDMREFYITYNKKNYELKVGKQIHSWGNVDENSPLDNGSALDYYYMFFGGTERKLATLSLGVDFYYKNLKINGVFSPLHSTNRLPLGDDDFPVELPIYPDPYEIIPVSSIPYEGGLFINYSTKFGEVSFSSFSGNDRIFNFSGVNEYYSTQFNNFKSSPDLVFGYRRTTLIGFGATILNKFFTTRFDYAYFNTKDQNKTIDRPYPNPLQSSLYDSVAFSFPLQENVKYEQYTIQIDTELPFDIDFSIQLFNHNINQYNSVDTLPDVEVDIPGFEYDPNTMQPRDLFIPGMGVPVAILTNKALFLFLKKNFLNEDLTFSFTSLMDIENYDKDKRITGALNEIKAEYSITQDLTLLLGITKINGSNEHSDGEKYQFYKMKDFSHSRFELKYYF